MTTSALSKFLNTPLLHSAVMPYLEKGLPKRQDRLFTFNSGFVPDSLVPILNKAHALTEKLHAFSHLAAASKGFRAKSDSTKSEIVELITTVHEAARGTKALRELVDTGCYLSALRVYFYVKPEALLNYADQARQEGFKRNILHNAAAPNGGISRISEPFFRFVLAMDRRHNLGLARQKDYYERTPLDHCRHTIGIYRHAPEYAAPLKKMEYLLLDHDPTPTLPSAPKVVPAGAPPVVEPRPSRPAIAVFVPPRSSERAIPLPPSVQPSLLFRIYQTFCRAMLYVWNSVNSLVCRLVR